MKDFKKLAQRIIGSIIIVCRGVPGLTVLLIGLAVITLGCWIIYDAG